jgi:hypothetical protein
LDSQASFTFNNDGLSFLDIAIKNKNEEVLIAIISHERYLIKY